MFFINSSLNKLTNNKLTIIEIKYINIFFNEFEDLILS